MVIHLNDYRSERATNESKPDHYGEELLDANWNPAIGVIVATGFQPAQVSSPELPEDFSEIDVDDFLARVYAFATQI